MVINTARALSLVEQLIDESPDSGTMRRAQKMKQRLTATPMMTILDKLPGKTVIERSRILKVSRQTYYYWLNGVTRPNFKQARKIARLTGYDAYEIHGFRAD